ncbi:MULTISPECIES: hypothetical protein [unclassified Nocardia]|uniref:hypothetical protein n=1 Tax=unclassified Nocardia TaxID=2637762 RepID=UPI001CE3FEE6|nr:MULTISPECIES: hypothetical protein [unclassified Nocardia]
MTEIPPELFDARWAARAERRVLRRHRWALRRERWSARRRRIRWHYPVVLVVLLLTPSSLVWFTANALFGPSAPDPSVPSKVAVTSAGTPTPAAPTRAELPAAADPGRR